MQCAAGADKGALMLAAIRQCRRQAARGIGTFLFMWKKGKDMIKRAMCIFAIPLLLATAAAPEAMQKSAKSGPGVPGGRRPIALPAPSYRDLAYASLSPAQKLDLYIPPSGSAPLPVVIMVHGGGFMFGDKAEGPELAAIGRLVAAGYAVASINYRLSGEAAYPAQIFDAKAAVRFLRANAGLYKLNPDKFGAWGASAGGNLVALLGTTCGVAELEGAELGNAGHSSCVQAAVDWFGPVDFLKMDSQFAGTGCPQTHDAADSPESRLVGAAIQTVPSIVRTTNPMNYITADDAPFFIQNGTADCNIPPVQNRNLADALRAVIGADKVTYVSLNGAGHGGPQFDSAENLNLVIGFLDRHLK
jgi:acetyl esterase/lipase